MTQSLQTPLAHAGAPTHLGTTARATAPSRPVHGDVGNGSATRIAHGSKAPARCAPNDTSTHAMCDGNPARIAPEDRAALARVCEHVAANLGRPIGTDELCRIALMSTSKLARLFKRSWGVTPQEYVRRLRMARACELLTETDAPLTEISQGLGYARQGSFSEAFHERFGITPTEYRRQKRAHRA